MSGHDLRPAEVRGAGIANEIRRNNSQRSYIAKKQFLVPQTREENLIIQDYQHIFKSFTLVMGGN